VLENNIIFVGKNILNKSLKPKVSKTYRLNQVNAASVADYLSTLGANISKVMLMSGSFDGQEIGDSFINKKEFEDEVINSYGMEKGLLYGIVGTADLRLQTITLIGAKEQMKIAEKFIKSLDVRHKQVALTIKIIDVSLTKADIKDNMFEFRTGDTRAIINEGLALTVNNLEPGIPGDGFSVKGFREGGLAEGKFANWLQAKITNNNAKILASPTLILGENRNVLTGGAASGDASLSQGTIGRPYKNEGFIKVGETVVTGFKQTANEGVVTCTATEGTAGITFGAKLEKIDDNGYVTFALSPAISAVTSTVTISGCGIQNTLSIRKLDTGSIRVKNGETLVLTGVLQDSDTIVTSKVPILGDIPILGSLFRSNANQKRKSELIILVTPKILKDK
jgi:type IV pilus assembly protein PilQ